MIIATRIFSVTAFPAVMVAAVASALLLMDRGVDPLVAIAPGTAFTYVFVLVFERVFPVHRSWLRARGDVPVDLAYLVTDGALLSAMRVPIYAGGLVLAGWLARPLQGGVWPGHWGLIPQLVLGLVVAELPKYGWHRLTHENAWLWRLHATHHSVPRLYFLNAARFHPIDIAMDTFLGIGTLAVLGCGQEIIALFLLVSAVHGLFQHTNLVLRLGPLNWFFSMAELHRWHHSRTVEEANHNYGQNLIVWDVVFGTRYLPSGREPAADVGLADLPAFPMTFFAQLASPFRWRRILRDSAGP